MSEELSWLVAPHYMGKQYFMPPKSAARSSRIRTLKRVYSRNPDYPGFKKVNRLIKKREKGNDKTDIFWRRVHNHTVAICHYEVTKLLDDDDQGA